MIVHESPAFLTSEFRDVPVNQYPILPDWTFHLVLTLGHVPRVCSKSAVFQSFLPSTLRQRLTLRHEGVVGADGCGQQAHSDSVQRHPDSKPVVPGGHQQHHQLWRGAQPQTELQEAPLLKNTFI